LAKFIHLHLLFLSTAVKNQFSKFIKMAPTKWLRMAGQDEKKITRLLIKHKFDISSRLKSQGNNRQHEISRRKKLHGVKILVVPTHVLEDCCRQSRTT
jgi:hypothetical protein